MHLCSPDFESKCKFKPARAGFIKTHFGLNQENAASQVGFSSVRELRLPGRERLRWVNVRQNEIPGRRSWGDDRLDEMWRARKIGRRAVQNTFFILAGMGMRSLARLRAAILLAMNFGAVCFLLSPRAVVSRHADFDFRCFRRSLTAEQTANPAQPDRKRDGQEPARPEPVVGISPRHFAGMIIARRQTLKWSLRS
jgi:hypothetical protein